MLRRLYPEVLSYIMTLAQDASTVAADTAEEHNLGSGLGELGPPPLQPFEITISHVNSQLRSVALSTARLWSHIYINTSVHSARTILEKTETYLRRSVGHLLDLRVELNGPTTGKNSFAETTINGMSQCELSQAMEATARESKRWKRLVIIAEYEGFAGVGDTLIARLGGVYDGKGKDGGLVPQLEYLFVSADYLSGLPVTRRPSGVSGGGAPVTLAPVVAADGHQQAHPQLHLLHATSDNTPREALFTPIVLTSHLPKLSFLRLRGLAVFLFRPSCLLFLRTLHLDQTKAIPMNLKLFARFTAACPALENLSVYGDIVTSSAGADGSVGLHVPHSVLGTGHAQPQHQQDDLDTGSGGGHQWRKSVNANANGRAICFPELRSLRICGTRGLIYRILLSQLEAPKLRSLVLKDAQEHDLDAIWEELFVASFANEAGRGGIKVFLTRPTSRFTQMRSLTISSSDLSKSVYQRLLKTFPRITEFASYSSIELDVVQGLFADDTMANMPCPSLRTLTFIFDVDLAADDVMIAEMLNRRKKFGCPIRKLCIGVSEMDMDDTIEESGSIAHDTVVVLEKLNEFDIWPSDRLYPDVDDVLF